MENNKPIIVRRLISGISLIVLSLYSFYRSYVFYNVPKKYSDIMDTKLIKFMIGNSNGLFIFGVLILVIGILFAFTSNKQPLKWLEYSIAIVYFLVNAICGFVTGSELAPITKIIALLGFLMFTLGLPFKNGFKNMPFKASKDNENQSSKTPNKISVNDQSDLNDLVKLKELLDSGIITQDDFNKKKKKILNI
jgi:hypothetical protein